MKKASLDFLVQQAPQDLLALLALLGYQELLVTLDLQVPKDPKVLQVTLGL